jgi:hypothetical protein
VPSLRRAYYRFQWLLLPLVLPLNGFNMGEAIWQSYQTSCHPKARVKYPDRHE